MKKILSCLLILALLLSLPLLSLAEKPLSIVATSFPAFDFARQIAGDRAQVTLLLPPGAEAHSFEPTPRDLIKTQSADLLVYTGGIGEHWVDRVLSSLTSGGPVRLRMMDEVDTVSEELVEGMEDAPHAHEHEHQEEAADHDHQEGTADHEPHDHGEEMDDRELDEHVWTSPKNALRISQAIARELIKLDPEGEDTYQKNLSEYQKALAQLDLDFQDLVQRAKRRTIVLGDRFPMRYFTREYGLSYYAAFPGCTAQTEPSAKTIAFLIDKIKKEQIPVVFYIEFSNQKSARVIAQETGALPLLLHSAHNVSQEELDAGITYLSIMQNNLNTLREALQ